MGRRIRIGQEIFRVKINVEICGTVGFGMNDVLKYLIPTFDHINIKLKYNTFYDY